MRSLVWFCLAALTLRAQAEPITGVVVGVTDGDTITVVDAEHHQHKIRLAGVDAPERKQPHGARAKEHLASLVFNRIVDVVGDKRDRYRRTVAKILMANTACFDPECPRTEDVGLLQVRSGLAWWYRQYAVEQSQNDRERYKTAEAAARSSRIGLWRADEDPIPPWEWRRRRHDNCH